MGASKSRLPGMGPHNTIFVPKLRHKENKDNET